VEEEDYEEEQEGELVEDDLYKGPVGVKDYEQEELKEDLEYLELGELENEALMNEEKKKRDEEEEAELKKLEQYN
jgi:hypothetical protein